MLAPTSDVQLSNYGDTQASSLNAHWWTFHSRNLEALMFTDHTFTDKSMHLQISFFHIRLPGVSIVLVDLYYAARCSHFSCNEVFLSSS